MTNFFLYLTELQLIFYLVKYNRTKMIIFYHCGKKKFEIKRRQKSQKLLQIVNHRCPQPEFLYMSFTSSKLNELSKSVTNHREFFYTMSKNSGEKNLFSSLILNVESMPKILPYLITLKLLLSSKGASIFYVEGQGGRGVSQISTLLNRLI